MIPKTPAITLPLLRAIGDGDAHRVRDLTARLADEFGLTDEERVQRLPSGTNLVFANRLWWAVLFLKRATLLAAPQRGAVQITERGKVVLADPPAAIDHAYLLTFPEYVAAQQQARRQVDEGGSGAAVMDGSGVPGTNAGGPGSATAATEAPEDTSPEEQLAIAYTSHRRQLETELLEQVLAAGHRFFEQVVIDVLLAIGYGGSRADAGRAFQTTGDGGVDGVINEDLLGLDRIYVQAKCNKPDNVVGRDRLQAFAGALRGQRASKGVFVTTSAFTRGAREYATDVGNIALIDGAKLVALMADHNVGVSPAGRYELKKIDSDYFEGS
ncbi:MAG: restriction endonuclease [Haliea sp.]|nr:MAG: restriction endonuclease [Haliea sp.]